MKHNLILLISCHSIYYLNVTMNTSRFVFILLAISLCNCDWIRWNDKEYLAYPVKRLVPDAVSICRQYGGDLAAPLNNYKKLDNSNIQKRFFCGLVETLPNFDHRNVLMSGKNLGFDYVIDWNHGDFTSLSVHKHPDPTFYFICERNIKKYVEKEQFDHLVKIVIELKKKLLTQNADDTEEEINDDDNLSTLSNTLTDTNMASVNIISIKNLTCLILVSFICRFQLM